MFNNVVQNQIVSKDIELLKLQNKLNELKNEQQAFREQEFRHIIQSPDFPQSELTDIQKLKDEFMFSPAQFTKRIDEVKSNYSQFLKRLGVV